MDFVNFPDGEIDGRIDGLLAGTQGKKGLWSLEIERLALGSEVLGFDCRPFLNEEKWSVRSFHKRVQFAISSRCFSRASKLSFIIEGVTMAARETKEL